jgi:hypothetical protein
VSIHEEWAGVIVTVGMVSAVIERIRIHGGDPESAHMLEDDLRDAVLWAIANGRAENPIACAHMALTSNEISFSRWYA